jgi:Ice-binding-like/Bacterial Ig-like domain
MNHLKTGFLFLLVSSLSACGGQMVDFSAGPDAGPAGGTGVAPNAASTAPPMVISTTPLDLAINVSINKRPTATFSKAMDPATLGTTTFTVVQGLNPISGAVTLDGATNTAIFTPAAPLGLDLLYTATVTTGAKDTGGLALEASYTWSFTTAACSQVPVVLGSASNFAVLAGSTVTNTGLTSITGDVGVSPSSAITGFGPGIIVGAQHAADPTAAQGIFDLTTAYDDAAGRTLCPVSKSGNLGGQTLTPGLYKSTSDLAITSGDLTLDAQGDGDAVFIFQMASTLTTTSGRQVILTNGARSANIFWQVGSSATLGTTSAFQGTIMADQAVTLDTGATLNGRALARIAAVSLDSNAIVMPTP